MEIKKIDYKILNYLEHNPNSNLEQIEKSLKNVKSIKDRIKSLHELNLIVANFGETSMFGRKLTTNDNFAISNPGKIKLQDYKTEKKWNAIKTFIIPVIVAIITSIITSLIANLIN
ncbi:winged helix-turn-helix domain-containing protein [Lactococcus lactis]|uniref:winged helix-turn-helix domain-containing protein n=1 Tax=Lactococcus lactis TaxID=1358 RepID=UPI0014562125|nr:winged helix-turn-helix domain-containing protein [Lactococcus lactis]MCT0439730.1 winged helix-turn-helix domain-containing protein [Lactococcus lactis subsp. lactis]NLS48093.1 winged helix-turn-helix domain-containing protein [Lactococcus lactis]